MTCIAISDKLQKMFAVLMLSSFSEAVDFSFPFLLMLMVCSNKYCYIHHMVGTVLDVKIVVFNGTSTQKLEYLCHGVNEIC